MAELTETQVVFIYAIYPVVLLIGGLFLLGAYRIATTKTLNVTWRWMVSEPATTRSDLNKWHIRNEKGWANIWPAVLGYGVVGGSLVYIAGSQMWEFYINQPDSDVRAWMLPGLVVSALLLYWLQRSPKTHGEQ